MEARYISLDDAIALTDQHCFESVYDAQWMEDALRNLQPANVVEKTEWDKLMFLVDAANQILEAAKWIPVDERLPENGTRCLVVRYDYVTDTPFVDILWFDNSWWNRINSGDYAVTHWMPLPQPPKEGGGDNE